MSDPQKLKLHCLSMSGMQYLINEELTQTVVQISNKNNTVVSSASRVQELGKVFAFITAGIIRDLLYNVITVYFNCPLFHILLMCAVPHIFTHFASTV